MSSAEGLSHFIFVENQHTRMAVGLHLLPRRGAHSSVVEEEPSMPHTYNVEEPVVHADGNDRTWSAPPQLASDMQEENVDDDDVPMPTMCEVQVGRSAQLPAKGLENEKVCTVVPAAVVVARSLPPCSSIFPPASVMVLYFIVLAFIALSMVSSGPRRIPMIM